MCARSLTAAAVALGVAGCMAAATGEPTDTRAPTFMPLPPLIKPKMGTAPVSTMRPGAPIMVGVDTPDDVPDDVRACLAGFYLDVPGTDGREHPGFLTAAECTQGDAHAPVFVTKTFEPAFEQIQIGDINYLSPGDRQPTVPGQVWTVPTSPLAVFGPGPDGWALPVEANVNGHPPSSTTVQSAELAWRAPATWTNSYQHVVTGHVLDPAATPELADLPAGIGRVVIAADDPAEPIDPWTRGSPVTVDLDGTTANLGILTGVDPDRHWIVVDLLSGFLAEHGARLRTG